MTETESLPIVRYGQAFLFHTGNAQRTDNVIDVKVKFLDSTGNEEDGSIIFRCKRAVVELLVGALIMEIESNDGRVSSITTARIKLCTISWMRIEEVG